MKAFVILELNIDQTTDIVAAINAIDPPSIPHFTGALHVVPEPHATALEGWLNEDA